MTRDDVNDLLEAYSALITEDDLIKTIEFANDEEEQLVSGGQKAKIGITPS